MPEGKAWRANPAGEATNLSRFVRRAGVRLAALGLVCLAASPLSAGDLVRGVRSKLSAGDLASGEAAVEAYRLKTGVDAEYLNAVGWLARGAEMLGRRDKAATFVAELRREIPEEKSDLLIPLGAAIEVEGKLRTHTVGRGAAIRFLHGELARAKDTSLRCRISKNLNLLGLEGQKAPELGGNEAAVGKPVRLAELVGRPVVVFLWAHWCGDCKGEAAKLGRLLVKYGPQGLVVVAPTRTFGAYGERKDVPPAEERAEIARVWAEFYPDLKDVSVPLNTETMVRYGVSSNPTYALIDRAGVVRLYAPTRLAETELSRQIETLLAEPR